MSEPASSGVLGTVLYKLLPASIGAGIMIAVDPPTTKRELFARAFVAFAASYLFGDVAFEVAQNYLIWLDPAKPAHWNAVAGVVGAGGWFVAGAGNQWFKKFRFQK
jgi:hypothetical protein